MAIIDEDLVVPFGDGKLVFEHPGARAEAVLTALGKKEGSEEYDEDVAIGQLWDMLLEVHNLQKKDGTPVTVESLKARDHSKPFFRRVVKGYFTALTKMVSGEYAASSGKEPTPAS